MCDILVAKHALIVNVDGQTHVLKPGTTVRAGHPLLAGREDSFEPIRVRYDLEAVTETADNAPAKSTRKTETR